MPRGRIINGLFSLAIAGLASSFVFANAAHAAQNVPVRTAVQQTIGPMDAPVRTAVLTQSDKQRVKIEPAGWGGYRGGYYAGYRGGFYGGYAPYVYRRPYYVAPYASYYPYAVPYYSAPYYPVAPYYTSYYPYSYGAAFAYPTPRRVYYGSGPVFPSYGACYW
ncbi:MAG TPA: hypothetical protein VGJ15_09145 [Pirellulales bacterium]